MKLISMTDFVLEQSKELSELLNLAQMTKAYMISYHYAQFLKQPLKLGMFVPCDDEGNVLEEPKGWNWFSIDPCRCEKCAKTHNIQQLDSYKQAKERVLFEGFYVEFNTIISPQGGYLDTSRFKYRNIESCIGADLTLTETAIKQIGW